MYTFSGEHSGLEADLSRQVRTTIRSSQLGIGCCMLLPWYKSLVAWDCLSIAFLVYTALVLPYRLAFAQLPIADEQHSAWDLSSPFDALEFAIDVFFLLDILRNMTTAYYDFYGDLVVEPRAVLMHYLMTWFALDLVASFPIDWFLVGRVETQSQGLVLLRLFKLGKLLRLLRLSRVGSRLSLVARDYMRLVSARGLGRKRFSLQRE